MKKINKMGAQGDVMFVRVDAIPEKAKLEKQSPEQIIVAHSETGHNHTVDGLNVKLFREPSDPMICYLKIEGAEDECASVVHHRSFDTHETIKLPVGLWQVRRQREYTPEGWRRVED